MSALFQKFNSGIRIGSAATIAALPALAQPGSLMWVDAESAFYQHDGLDWTSMEVDLSNYETKDLAEFNILVGNALGKSSAMNTVVNGDILADEINALTIKANAVTSAKILDNAVTESKISNGSVTDGKLAFGIDAAKIANGLVSNIEFQYLDGVTSSIQTQLTASLDRINHIGEQAISTVTGLQAALDGKAAEIHTHVAADITDFTTAARTAVVTQVITVGVTATAPSENAVYDALALKIDNSEKGAVNGVATLDGNQKVPLSQLPNSIMEYKGTWSAATNAPLLANGVGNADTAIGDVYRVIAAGTVDFGAGNITFAVGDYAILNDSKIWEKAATSEVVAGVSSVNGEVGDVVLDSSDLNHTQALIANWTAVNNSPISTHLDELAARTKAIEDSPTDLSNYETTTQLNDRDTANRDRVNHTGVQAISTVTGLQAALDGKATTELDNLGTTAINAALLPSAADLRDLGSAALAWKDVHVKEVKKNDAGEFMVEKYVDAMTLAANTFTPTAIAALTFEHTFFEGFEMVYKMKEATTSRVRIGTLKVVTNGTDISLTDSYNETAIIGVGDGVKFSAAVNVGNIEIRFTDTAANVVTMRAEVKLIRASIAF